MSWFHSASDWIKLALPSRNIIMSLYCNGWQRVLGKIMVNKVSFMVQIGFALFHLAMCLAVAQGPDDCVAGWADNLPEAEHWLDKKSCFYGLRGC
jgi:hypothetical protein